MSLEQQIEDIVRKVIREELARQSRDEEIDLLTADQAAERLGYSDRHSVYKLKREGKLKAVSLGDSTLRFSKAEVRRFIEARTA
ncbi:MAG TPA: helix-turn-helix domain-containing protein [Pyrinomonadaceae bacterium]|nr:helix-turn-helix domain-containing protein [Pyrinomonadaceae bacterium]HLA13022.1 helix-turn-helix domain-containing protein [Pyrinomonadaceae bacterium]